LSLIDRIGAEMLEVTIPKDSPVVGKKLMDVGLPKGVLFAMVNRKGNIILPRGDMVIKGEDTISIFATGDLLPRALRILGIQK
jgi:trk system potassium uptake protein TrkA